MIKLGWIEAFQVANKTENAKPTNSKARQWRAVQSGTKPGNSVISQSRASQKSEPPSSEKLVFVIGSFVPVSGPEGLSDERAVHRIAGSAS